ncbi:hypothetical protein HGRIS_011188 [Hohenbuehelia grisea]|uniref:Uncharacterized protein n=1 Tax=Hohenbuehelia grisea TaxID=104357 RepID=A0ABR3JUD7_9AGAR
MLSKQTGNVMRVTITSVTGLSRSTPPWSQRYRIHRMHCSEGPLSLKLSNTLEQLLIPSADLVGVFHFDLATRSLRELVEDCTLVIWLKVSPQASPFLSTRSNTVYSVVQPWIAHSHLTYAL